MNLKSRPDTLLLAFITFSLLLHLLLFFLLPQRDLFPVPARPEPVIVELRPPAPPRQRELDLPARPEPEKPRETPAKRLGPSDQIVKKEIAPKGADTEDMRPPPPPFPPAPRPRPQPAPQTAPATSSTPKPAESGRPAAPELSERPPAPAAPLPDLKTLTELPSATVARLEQQWEKEWRQKYRSEVEQGDTYWLDTEKDILISFFKRLQDRIYEVWTYPQKAGERGEEGDCLLKVTINHNGTLRDVQLLESSGFPLLDDEALDAVKRGAPYGALHSAYQKETISIFLRFRYDLIRVNQRRPGSIY